MEPAADIGIQMSGASSSSPEKSTGATPITVNVRSPRSIVAPTALGLEEKCCTQYPWLSTATVSPSGSVSSAGLKNRPIAGRTPSVEK